MPTDEKVQAVLNSLYDIEGCDRCGTRIRFGDVDCPHCGAELYDLLYSWAKRVVDAITE